MTAMSMKEVIVALKDGTLPYVAISGTNLQPAFPEHGTELWPFYANASKRQMLVWVEWNLSDYVDEPDERHANELLAAEAQEELGRGLKPYELRLLADGVRDHMMVTHALDEARKAAQLKDTQDRLHDPFFGLRAS